MIIGNGNNSVRRPIYMLHLQFPLHASLLEWCGREIRETVSKGELALVTGVAPTIEWNRDRCARVCVSLRSEPYSGMENEA